MNPYDQSSSPQVRPQFSPIDIQSVESQFLTPREESPSPQSPIVDSPQTSKGERRLDKMRAGANEFLSNVKQSFHNWKDRMKKRREEI